MLDDLLSGFKNAIDDTRSKLIDEDWFGRRAAPPSQFDVGTGPASGREPFAMARPSFEDGWAVRSPADALSHDDPADREIER